MKIIDTINPATQFISLEYFPPKTREDWPAFFKTVGRLAVLKPLFASVTYGAGGSTNIDSLEIVSRIQQEFGIETMAHLGLYYAAKIRGACDLALFDESGDATRQASAVQHLAAALNHWKNYSSAYTRQYVQPLKYNRAGLVDIPKQTEDVAADVQMARDWKPGAIVETEVKRSATEAGFKK